MKTALIIIGIVLVILVSMFLYGYYRMKNAPEVRSSKKIQQLNSKNFKAKTRNNLVLVDFWAPWCAPCRMMSPVLNDIAEDESLSIVVAKVNVDEEKELAGKHKIRNIPTIIVFKDGHEVKRIVGVKTKKVILKELEPYME